MSEYILHTNSKLQLDNNSELTIGLNRVFQEGLWILAFGYWNDNAYWIDTEYWID